MDSRILHLVINNTRNLIAENLYLKYGVDITHPTQIYGLVNTRCNAKCRMCDSWKMKNSKEKSAAVWIKGLKSLKSFLGTFHINFSGGEPLLKRDFFDIIEFCTKEKILAGITTNGLLLHRENIQHIIDLKVFNINISLDSMDDYVHNHIRGIPGMLARIKENINNLTIQKKATGSGLRVILKPIVCKENLSKLDEIVKYADEMRLTGVSFQPIFKGDKETEEMFKVDQSDLVAMINKLIKMKKGGYNILNSETSIRQWMHYFQGKVPDRSSSCRIALRNLLIESNGDVSLCNFCESKFGNINNDDIRKIWYSDKAKKLRKTLVNCRRLCLATCVVKRSWKDYFQLFFKLLKN